jgi:hypothetical protein
LWRDACALAYLWETKGRGKECAELLTTDFVRSGVECVPCWDAICARQLAEGEVVLVEPSRGTKVRKTRHPGVVALQRGGGGLGELSLLAMLPEYEAKAAASGNALQGWVFRPCAGPGTKRFKATCYSSGALNKRLQLHLRERGLWRGETLHGVRRGRAQDDKEARQMSLEEIAEEGLWASVESVRDYVHPTRHSARLRLDGSGPSNEVGDDGPLGMVLPGSVGNAGAGHEAPFLVGAGSGEPEAGDDRELGHESG